MRHLGVAVLLAVAAAGCGGSSSSAPAKASGATRAALKAAVYGYTSELLGGDPEKAWAVVSPDCQVKIGHDPYMSQAQQLKELYGGLTVTSFSIDSFSPPRATVTYGTAVTSVKKSNQPWVYDNGWRFDDC